MVIHERFFFTKLQNFFSDSPNSTNQLSPSHQNISGYHAGHQQSQANTFTESQRLQEIRKKQATPVMEYCPWGRPGAGAPLKGGTGDIRSALQRYVSIVF